MRTKVDFLGTNGQGQGAVANHIMNNGNMSPGEMRPFIDSDGRAKVSVYTGGDPMKPENYRNHLVTNATLRRDEWKQLDEALLDISRYRIGGAQDLIDAGLVYNLGNGLGSTVLEYHDISDHLEAELSMDGERKSKNDRPNFTTKYLPIPIIHVDFQINKRVLEASRKLGNPLDTTSVQTAGRKVMERLENMLFTNVNYAFGGGTIYSYVNHPDRNTVSLGTSWTTETPANILAKVLELKQASIAAFHYGPWVLYIPTAYETVMDKDYDPTAPTGTTLRERILKIAGITGIKVNDTLAADNVLLVQMTPDVVRLVNGMAMSVVEWESMGKFLNNYKVMRISVPQIRSDQAGNSGIVHAS